MREKKKDCKLMEKEMLGQLMLLLNNLKKKNINFNQRLPSGIQRDGRAQYTQKRIFILQCWLRI